MTDFDNLQAAADAASPQPHHHGPWGYLAGGAAIAALSHHERTKDDQHPAGHKNSPIPAYVLIALAVHLVLAFMLSLAGAEYSFYGLGCFIWIPAWIAAGVHHARVREHNRGLA